MSILLPGLPSARTTRKSALLFHWRARDASLDPLTGQAPTLTAVDAAAGGPIIPAYGASPVVAGHAMPRFGRMSVGGVATNFLELSGLTAGQDAEALSYEFSPLAQDLSVLIRLTGLWTAGASLATGYAFSLGNGTTGAGTIRLLRTGTNWQAQRVATPGTSSVNVAESSGLVWPADVLLTFVLATGVVTLSLRGGNGTLYGPASTVGEIATGRFAGEVLALGSDALNGAGQPMRLVLAKVAPGVQTFTTMDALE